MTLPAKPVQKPAKLALTVSDALGADAAAARIGEIQKRTLALSNFTYLCIRDDLRSPDSFADICGVAAVLWEGPLVIESDEPEAIAKGCLHLVGRKPLVHCREAHAEASAIAASLGCRVLSLPGDDGDAVDTGTQDLSEIPDAIHLLKGYDPSRPVTVHVPAGEYGVSTAAAAMMLGADLIIADDLDAASCALLDRIATYRTVRRWDP